MREQTDRRRQVRQYFIDFEEAADASNRLPDTKVSTKGVYTVGFLKEAKS